MHVSATELNKRPGTYIDCAAKEPVVVEKAGHPKVVIVSYERYMELEDMYWGELATRADKKGKFLTRKQTMDFLKSDGKL